MDYNCQKLCKGGYLFLQFIYYGFSLDQICRKIHSRHHYQYDLNAILSDLIYTRILEPVSKRTSCKTALEFLENPSYQEHDVLRSLDVLADECDFIQSENYKNSNFLINRNDGVLFYNCTNYYFEIEQEEGIKKTEKARSTAPILSGRWNCSRTEPGSAPGFLYLPWQPE